MNFSKMNEAYINKLVNKNICPPSKCMNSCMELYKKKADRPCKECWLNYYNNKGR